MTIRVADQVCGASWECWGSWGAGGALGAGLSAPARPLVGFQWPGLQIGHLPQQPLPS